MTEQKPEKKGLSLGNMTLAVLAGQVGCLTLIIVLAAVFGGLWLDSHFGTKPWFTIGLLLGSIPISVVVMVVVARAAVSKIKTGQALQKTPSKEEGIGKDA